MTPSKSATVSCRTPRSSRSTAAPLNTRILCSDQSGEPHRVVFSGSAQVELVALRVAHRDLEMVMIGDPPDDRCAKSRQSADLGLDVGGTRWDGVTAERNVEVKVEPVLDRLGLWDLLEVQCRPPALGIAYRGRGPKLYFQK